MTRKFLIAPVLTFLVCSCSSDNDKIHESHTPEEYIGVWKTQCQLRDPTDTDSNYMLVEDIISQASIDSTYLFFTDSACSSPDSPAKIILNTQHTFVAGESDTALGKADHVDIKLLAREIDGQPFTEGVGTTLYAIILVLENSLYYGTSSSDADGRTPASRYRELDQEIVYTRQ